MQLSQGDFPITPLLLQLVGIRTHPFHLLLTVSRYVASLMHVSTNLSSQPVSQLSSQLGTQVGTIWLASGHFLSGAAAAAASGKSIDDRRSEKSLQQNDDEEEEEEDDRSSRNKSNVMRAPSLF